MTPQHFMQLCLDDAARYLATVAPNPMVGACLVHNGQILALGSHQFFGGPHAEVNVINRITDRTLLESSTLYVTLEPCNHHGKTPPCCDLIIDSGIKHVIVATRDPNPLVAGTGVARLRESGIKVEEGIHSDASRFLNRRFFTAHLRKRPYIILKWAQTADGFIARPDFSSKWISGEESRRLVHRWRSEEQAIMVGANTALHDDPALTARHGGGKNPLRVVFDGRNSLPDNLKLWNDEARTLRFSLQTRSAAGNEKMHLLASGQEPMQQICAVLAEERVQSIVIEGGAKTIADLIRNDLWDEARVFASEVTFGDGVRAPELPDYAPPQNPLLKTARCQIGQDQLSVYFNPALQQLLDP